MQRREILLDTLKLGQSGAIARARLRFKSAEGIVGGGLSLEAHLSDELHEHIRCLVETELAGLIGDDCETFSDGTVARCDDWSPPNG